MDLTPTPRRQYELTGIERADLIRSVMVRILLLSQGAPPADDKEQLRLYRLLERLATGLGEPAPDE